MLPFKSENQVQELKNLPILEAAIEKHKKLGLASLEVKFNLTFPEGSNYYAFATYRENPTDVGDIDNFTHTTKIVAKSWPELIDKVIEHFEGKDGGDQQTRP